MNWGSEKVGNNKLKRDISLTDESKKSVIVTLWGGAYEEFECAHTPVLIHNGIVVEFRGVKTINVAPSTLFGHNPEIDVAKKLKDWFDEEMENLKKNNFF